MPIRYHIAFTNPRTGQKEHIWFRSKRSRNHYIFDLEADFGSILIEQWEDAEPQEAA